MIKPIKLIINVSDPPTMSPRGKIISLFILEIREFILLFW